LKAWGYSRVSTADQADHGVSLEAQTERIRVWCAATGYELVDVLVDPGIGGRRCDNRPALQAALKAVGRGDVLVVLSLSRLARSLRDTLAITEALTHKGADLISLTERIDTSSATGKLQYHFLISLAQFEADIIGERTRMAMAQLRSQGKFCGGRPPTGNARGEDGYLIEVPEEQRALGLARRMRKAGKSLRGISKALASRGLLSRAATPFSATQVRRMLGEHRPVGACA